MAIITEHQVDAHTSRAKQIERVLQEKYPHVYDRIKNKTLDAAGDDPSCTVLHKAVAQIIAEEEKGEPLDVLGFISIIGEIEGKIEAMTRRKQENASFLATYRDNKGNIEGLISRAER